MLADLREPFSGMPRPRVTFSRKAQYVPGRLGAAERDGRMAS